MNKETLTVRKLARCAVVAALYVALCLGLAPFSYGAVQVRVAEALCLLPLFGPEYILGVTLGCALANLLGSTMIDVVFGTLATFLACLCTYAVRHARVGGLAIPPSSSAPRSRSFSPTRRPPRPSSWPTPFRWARARSSAAGCWAWRWSA